MQHGVVVIFLLGDPQILECVDEVSLTKDDLDRRSPFHGDVRASHDSVTI